MSKLTMKKIRLACLSLTLLALVASPSIVRADLPLSCDPWCRDFADWCAGFCYDHGGTMLCNTHVGFYCSDLCYCVDQTMYEDGSGMCSPCIGG